MKLASRVSFKNKTRNNNGLRKNPILGKNKITLDGNNFILCYCIKLFAKMSQTKQEKVQVSIDNTGEGIEIQEGAVGVDINVVEENISVEVNHKTWFSISFSGVYKFLGDVATGCLNVCRKKDPPVVSEPATHIIQLPEPPVVNVVETTVQQPVK